MAESGVVADIVSGILCGGHRISGWWQGRASQHTVQAVIQQLCFLLKLSTGELGS